MSCKALDIFSAAFNRNQVMAKALGEVFLRHDLVKYYIKSAKQGLYHRKYNWKAQLMVCIDQIYTACTRGSDPGVPHGPLALWTLAG